MWDALTSFTARKKAMLAFVVTVAVAYSVFTGPEDLQRYPDRATSAYRLPWEKGAEWICIQSNRGIVSHRGREEFAFDFRMPVGSEVRAARAGVVTRVIVTNDGLICNASCERVYANASDLVLTATPDQGL